MAGSISLDSDYRLRGFSLTDHGPALSAHLSYDSPTGLYAGGSLIAAAVPHDGTELVGRIAYAGFAVRRGAGSWDAGASTQRYFSYRAGLKTPVNYEEVYAGWNGERMDVHLRYSPNYLRPRVRTLYLDVNGTLEPSPDWRLFGHLGVTQFLHGAAPGAPRRRWDARVGLARQFDQFDVHVAFTARGPDTPGPSGEDRTALIVGASYVF